MMKRWEIFSILIAVMILYGCGMAEPTGNPIPLPREEYKVPSKKAVIDEALIEGDNEVVFTITPEKRAQYIPKTIWREAEKSADEEECSFTLIASCEGVEEQELLRFLSGESKALRMGKGDWFFLELKDPYWLSELGMAAEGKVNAMVMDRSMTKPYAKLTFSTPQEMVFDVPVLCKYLLVRAPDEAGAELRHLYAKGKPVFSSQITRAMADNPVVLDAKDSRNPLSIWRQSLTDDYYRLAEKLLEGTDILSDHQKMMVFMDYIADFYVGVQRKEKGFEEYIGACGNYSNLLAALACTQGIPARVLLLANYPINGGHNVCEVFYDDSWHVYDPTYGAYYTTSSAEETVHPYVLGFEELAQGRGNVSDVVCVVTSPHKLSSKGAYSYLGPRIYEEAVPKGAIGQEQVFAYPLTMATSSNGSTVLTKKDFSTGYQGIQYIGLSSANNIHKWTLSELEAGREYELSVVGAFVGGGRPETPFHASASSENVFITEGEEHIFDNSDKSTMEWKIRFVPEFSEGQMTLGHDYRGPEWHYVMFSSFELRRVD